MLLPDVDGTPPTDVETSTPRSVPPLEGIYRTHYAFVHRSVRRLGVPPHATADVTQDVFMVVARKLPSYDERGSLRAWLFAITSRVVRTRQRSRRRHARKLAVMRAAPGHNAHDNRSQLERSDLLGRFLDELEPEQRAVFVLSELEGMSATEIGESLGVSPNTVYSRQRAARARLERAVARHRARVRRGVAALVVVDLEQLLDAERTMPTATPAAPLATATATAGTASATTWTIGAAVLVAAGLTVAGKPQDEPRPKTLVNARASTAPASAKPGPAGPGGQVAVTAPDPEPPTTPSPTPAEPADAAATSTAPAPRRARASGPKSNANEKAPPADATDALVREATLLGDAWAQLKRGNIDRARRLARTHARDFRQGEMAPEREAILAIADCRAEARGAKQRAERFLKTHAASPHAKAVRQACEP